MEKKNNGGLIAIIIVLIVALLGLSFYVAYDKGLIFNNKEEVEEKNEEDENNETKDLDINSALVLNLYENVYDKHYGSETYSRIYGKLENELLISDMTEKQKMLLVYTKLDELYFEYKACSNSTYYYDVDNGYTDKNYQCNLNGGTSTQFISGQAVKNKYKEIFGSLDSFSYDTVMIDSPFEVQIFVYDATSDGYYRYGQIGGWTGAMQRERTVTSAKQVGDTIEITEHVKYVQEGIMYNEADITYVFNKNDEGNYYLHKVKKSNEIQGATFE